jgi:hypothetical protein
MLCVILASASGVGAQEIGDFQFFPIVARTAGLGVPPTQWVTDLVINNLTGDTLIVGIIFFPANTANPLDLSFPTRITLGPRETLIVEDVLATLFGYSEDVKGSLLLSCSSELIAGNPEEAYMLATTRTYNVGSPAGTFGQTIPWTWNIVNVYATPSFVTGARNDARFRSNLGVVNFSLDPVTVRYRIYAGTAVLVAEGDLRDIPPLSAKQWAFSRLGVGMVDAPLTVDLWFDPDDVPVDPCSDEEPVGFIAYVSKVDGNPDGTGDAEFIYAAPAEPMYCDK